MLKENGLLKLTFSSDNFQQQDYNRDHQQQMNQTADVKSQKSNEPSNHQNCYEKIQQISHNIFKSEINVKTRLLSQQQVHLRSIPQMHDGRNVLRIIH